MELIRKAFINSITKRKWVALSTLMSNLTVFQPQINPLWTIINLLLSIGVVSSLSTLIRLDSLNVLGLSPTLNNSLKLLFHHTIAETMWYDKRFTFLIAYIRTIVVAKFQQISISMIPWHLISFIYFAFFFIQSKRSKRRKPNQSDWLKKIIVEPELLLDLCIWNMTLQKSKHSVYVVHKFKRLPKIRCTRFSNSFVQKSINILDNKGWKLK